MGRKRHNLAGLSRFVQEAFKSPADDTSTGQSADHTPPNADAESSNIVTGAKRTASQRDEAGSDAATPDGNAAKKHKIGLLGPGHEKYDATGLVPFYTEESEVPRHLRKYEEGWYSVTPELIATQIAERCRCDTILDAFCGVGGNAIAFAQTCERVIAIDTSPTRLALARHNAVIYGVEDRIEFILGDYLSFAEAYMTLPNSSTRKIDAIFLSPPWGGPEYLAGSTTTPVNGSDEAYSSTPQPSEGHPQFSLSQIKPIHGAELFKLSRKITKNIAYFLPRNTNLDEISALLDKQNRVNEKSLPENVEVEEEWMGPKLKALTCYFGGLVSGQEELFNA
ncbi:hypothetical protein NM688_g8357 [Phlebia brevispora]|uniref:Uncharacterized protein n=1 Tax=Phlebia brevispora TaxID=194682 RepID=A0ACC1RUB7_9APHY|nr:hypothetical protein NM688_g8357 [Phlebia brevispora]